MRTQKKLDKRDRKHPFSSQNRKKGSTFVELVVGFVILVLLIGTFTKVIVQSNKLLKKSQEIRVNAEAVLSSYYKQKYNAQDKGETTLSETEEKMTLKLVYKDEEIELENQKIKKVTGNGVTIYEFVTDESKE